MNHKQNAERYFAEELAYIQNKEIKEFVLDVFDKLTPDYFWTVPCSTSGKYHPHVSLGVGGLIRHVKLAVWWGLELSKATRMGRYHDEMVAALLLHDLIKNGKGLDSDGRPLDRSVTGTHGVDLFAKLHKMLLDNTLSYNFRGDVCERICIGIASHMGIWTTPIGFKPEDIPPALRQFINLIHLADYCASRKVDDKMLKLNRLVINKRKYPCPKCETGELYDSNAGGMFCAMIKCDNPDCDFDDSSDACGCVTS